MCPLLIFHPMPSSLSEFVGGGEGIWGWGRGLNEGVVGVRGGSKVGMGVVIY